MQIFLIQILVITGVVLIGAIIICGSVFSVVRIGNTRGVVLAIILCVGGILLASALSDYGQYKIQELTNTTQSIVDNIEINIA